MSISYTSQVNAYVFHQVANDGAGTFTLTLGDSAPTYLESELDAAMEAFANSLNPSYTINSITRTRKSSAADDWSYTI